MSKESRILLVIYVADLLATIWLITTGQATEGNPIMSYYLSKGWLPLVAIKAMLFVLPVFVLEWCRRSRPVFVHRMLRFAIAVYLGLYVVALIDAGIAARSDDFELPPAPPQQLRHVSR